jgi:hypothetical protein
MSTEAKAERQQRLEADVDARLLELWAMLWRETPNPLTSAIEDEEARSLLASVMRQAYGQGYHDALLEDAEGRRGLLASRHGYRHH